MDKKKSFIIVLIFSIMFGTLVYCFYEIMTPAFIVVVSILSAYGFVRGIIDFDTWLRIDPNKAYSSNENSVEEETEENKEEENNIYEVKDIIEEFK